MLIWIKSNLILKKYLVTNLSIIKAFSKPKLKSYFNDATDFHDKEMSKVDSNHTCLAVISWNSSHKKFQYNEEEQKVIRHMTYDLGKSSHSDECAEEFFFL